MKIVIMLLISNVALAGNMKEEKPFFSDLQFLNQLVREMETGHENDLHAKNMDIVVKAVTQKVCTTRFCN